MLLMPSWLMVMAPCLRRRRGLGARRLAKEGARALRPGARTAERGRGRLGPAGGPGLRRGMASCCQFWMGVVAGVVVVGWACGLAMVVGPLGSGLRTLVGGRPLLWLPRMSTRGRP